MKRASIAMILIGILSADTWAGEIMVVGGTKTVRSGNRTYVVPGADTTSDYGFGISGQIQKTNGLWVTEVEKGTDAAKLGLEAYDWIVAVNDKTVTMENWEAAFKKGGRIRFAIKDHKTEKIMAREVTVPESNGRPVMHNRSGKK